MRSPRPRSWAGLALGLVLATTSAGAGPVASSLPRIEPSPPARPSATQGGLAVCQLGQTGDFHSSWNGIFFGDDDCYYTLIDLQPGTCAGCTTDTYALISAAHISLYFPTAPQSCTVGITLIGAASWPQCGQLPYPDNVLCPEFNVVLDNPTDPAINQPFVIPFLSECRLYAPPGGTGKAFMRVNFKDVQNPDPAAKPQISYQSAMNVCESFNVLSATTVGAEDEWTSKFNLGNPIMYVDVDQCQIVATRRPTWGQLKLIYR